MKQKAILEMYQKNDEDPFYREYGNSYHSLLCTMRMHSFLHGPMRYVPKTENYHLVTAFLKYYFVESSEEFEQEIGKKIQLYTVEELEDFICCMEASNENDKTNISNMSVMEAKELLNGCRGLLFYVTKNMWQLQGIDNQNLSSGMTLLHEYVHKLDEDQGYSESSFEIDILSEVKAYYATFLLAEYVSSLGLSYEATLALEQISFLIENCIKQYQITMEKLKETPDMLDNTWLKTLLLDDSFALNDYHHILGYILANRYYHEQDGRSLTEKCHWLQEAMIHPDDLLTSFRDMMQEVKNKNKVKIYTRPFQN